MMDIVEPPEKGEAMLGLMPVVGTTPLPIFARDRMDSFKLYKMGIGIKIG
jgi:hypothetical protein